MKTLDNLIRNKRVVICVGSGGVGKTTTSAAIALHGALSGLKSLVLTVDPAKRLANSLGLTQLTGEVRKIDHPLLNQASQSGNGALYAMMLDTKGTFDRLIHRYAPDENTRQTILNNPFYKQMSTALAGTHEYMAIEKLFEIKENLDYDLIVLDTPPTAHALDFLDAPNRIVELLDNKAFQLFLGYTRSLGKISLKIFNRDSYILKGLSTFLGSEFLIDLLDFIASFNAMFEGFSSRSREVQSLFTDPKTAFIIITIPSKASIEEGLFFHEHLRQNGMPFGAFIVNRVNEYLKTAECNLLKDDILAYLKDHNHQKLPGVFYEKMTSKITEICGYLKYLSTADQKVIDRLRGLSNNGKKAAVYTVPIFEYDIHDVTGLHNFSRFLFPQQ